MSEYFGPKQPPERVPQSVLDGIEGLLEGKTASKQDLIDACTSNK